MADYSKEYAVHEKAHAAGHKAATECVPVPMTVMGMGHDDYVNEGVCGFAWVLVKPGNSRYANMMKKENIGRRDSYRGGVSFWIGAYGQSLARKESYADAYAAVVREELGIKIYAQSRMD